MRIVLSDKDLSEYTFSSDVLFKKVSYRDLEKYDGNENVLAIAGSRAMAIKAADMALPNLRLFQLTSAGFDYVPLSKYREKGVAVANAGAVYSVPIAETVVFGILLTAKKLRKNPNNRRFKFVRGYKYICELADKKVLIMGAGNIGTAIADRLQGFQMQIDGYDPYCKDKPQYKNLLRTRQELLEKIFEYDYIVSTMPDNEQTQGFIDAELFGKMKKTAIIVNVGRKAVFQQEDFYQALKRKEIGGAVLDMFEKFPNPLTNKFRRLNNVVVLPGVAAISREVGARLKEHIYQNIMAAAEGEKISNVINEVK